MVFVVRRKPLIKSNEFWLCVRQLRSILRQTLQRFLNHAKLTHTANVIVTYLIITFLLTTMHKTFF